MTITFQRKYQLYRLNSKIDKSQINYSDIYALTAEDRYYNTGQGENDITVISETWKYEQKLFNNLTLDAYTSFSLSKNDSINYRYEFEEQDAYTESVLRKVWKTFKIILKIILILLIGWS